QATPGIDDNKVKEEEQEQGKLVSMSAPQPGKRKLGGMAKALQRYSILTAGSRQPNGETLSAPQTRRPSANGRPPHNQQRKNAGAVGRWHHTSRRRVYPLFSPRAGRNGSAKRTAAQRRHRTAMATATRRSSAQNTQTQG
ncbi:unnamed protein product, partial [Ectocarpus sp. 8 AP-2014]